MVRVLKETSPLEEDRHSRNEQDEEVLQRLSFNNPIFLDDVDFVFGNDFFYVIGFFIFWFVVLCVIMTMSRRLLS